ncbi:MAG: hypothetical protein M3243_02845 [Thermoproteota archaeon]|nr:hypothetical protein [Thermoproteota archaeon]
MSVSVSVSYQQTISKMSQCKVYSLYPHDKATYGPRLAIYDNESFTRMVNS